MVLHCHKCRRANPPGAVYCYHDGIVLDGHSAPPVPVGSRPLPHSFVFPSGQACQTLEELAFACNSRWKEARDLLRQGTFKSYLGNVGRADLALEADKASQFPDPDRGLDQFLAALPCPRLSAPVLEVRPAEVNLGVLTAGQDRQFTLELRNAGMRLVHGSMRSDSAAWLSVGDAPEAFFHFTDQKSVVVHVRGKHLAASAKPLEGKIVLGSSGGDSTVVVRVEVPLQPFPSGILAGAKSPRQVAEKAKLYPKEAAPFFESGAVARWYESNGWSYPVRGPAAAGMGAVQQFFEALGLAKPPRVEISTRSVVLRYPNLSATLEVRTSENRPLYASAACDQRWLEIGPPVAKGRALALTISVPNLPPASAPTRAVLEVLSNGNQRFEVAVELADLPARPPGSAPPGAWSAAPQPPVPVVGAGGAPVVVPLVPVVLHGPAMASAADPLAQRVRIRSRGGDAAPPPVRNPDVPTVAPTSSDGLPPATKSGCVLLLGLLGLALLGSASLGWAASHRTEREGPLSRVAASPTSEAP